jgi:hypothetical protein
LLIELAVRGVWSIVKIIHYNFSSFEHIVGACVQRPEETVNFLFSHDGLSNVNHAGKGIQIGALVAELSDWGKGHKQVDFILE